MGLNLIFAGTAEFAVPSLKAIAHSSHTLQAVYTQPDRPAGRGLKLTASAIKTAALDLNLPIFQPLTLKDPEVQQRLAAFKADAMVVVVYGLLIPPAVLTMFPLGCINVHPSLLPKWRGAAPIQRAIEAGDSETGVTIMQLDEGWDTGDILLQQRCALSAEDTSESVHQRLALTGADLLVKTLDQMAAGNIQRTPQQDALATHAAKLSKLEGELDWHLSAVELERKIRAFNPWPVAYTYWQGEVLRIWGAQALEKPVTAPPGTLATIDDQGIEIATGRGTLRLLKVQLPGGKLLPIQEFIRARRSVLIPFQTYFGTK
ncbi:MAG: methionyl-tRNA formyltransferase [Gammaproteobacteria bacterium]